MRAGVGVLVLSAVIAFLGVGCGKTETPSTAPAGSSPLVTPAEKPKIVIAATAAVKIEAPFQVATDPTAAGGKFVFAPLGPKEEHTNKPCTATYEFAVAQAGDYCLWIHKKWSGGCSNSLFVKMDDQPEFIFGEDATYDRWDWTSAIGKSFNLTAGKHTLVIKNREDDSKFDQILLIADKDYVPVAIEGP
jgi:hypothetical protein